MSRKGDFSAISKREEAVHVQIWIDSNRVIYQQKLDEVLWPLTEHNVQHKQWPRWQQTVVDGRSRDTSERCAIENSGMQARKLLVQDLGSQIALSNASQFDANAFPCYVKSSHDHEAAHEFTASCIGAARFVFLWVGPGDPTIAHPVPPVDDASNLQDTYRAQLDAYLESQAELKAPSNNVFTLPWRLVRYLPTGWTFRHPAKDNLAGTDDYGTFQDPTNAWSVDFGEFNEYLFATRKRATDSSPYTADIDLWLHCEKDAVSGGYYSNEARPVIESSKNKKPHNVRWYNRGEGNPEDPWISLRDHPTQILYGEAEGPTGPFDDKCPVSMVFVRSALPGNFQVSHMSLDDVQVAAVTDLKPCALAKSNVSEGMIDAVRQQTDEGNLPNLLLRLYAVERCVALA